MSKKKQFYEKPVSVDAGKIASVLGAICSDGGVATDGCVEGNDPHVSPTCTPGATASFHCDTGSTNNTTCWDGGTAIAGSCESGTSAGGICSSGGSALS